MNLADLKRRLQLGVKVKLIEAPTMPNHKFLGVIREVTKVQTNAVKLGSSFLDFPKAANIIGTENTFTILENGKPFLVYEFVK